MSPQEKRLTLVSEGRSSNEWVLKTTAAGDAYLFPRIGLDPFKVSLHASGYAHLSLVGTVRRQVSWRYREAPEKWQVVDGEPALVVLFDPSDFKAAAGSDAGVRRGITHEVPPGEDVVAAFIVDDSPVDGAVLTIPAGDDRFLSVVVGRDHTGVREQVLTDTELKGTSIQFPGHDRDSDSGYGVVGVVDDRCLVLVEMSAGSIRASDRDTQPPADDATLATTEEVVMTRLDRAAELLTKSVEDLAALGPHWRPPDFREGAEQVAEALECGLEALGNIDLIAHDEGSPAWDQAGSNRLTEVIRLVRSLSQHACTDPDCPARHVTT